MTRNEVTARAQNLHFSYIAEERSARTGGHLWREKIVEIDDGPLRRLLAVDGKPLSPADAQAENNRINDLVKDPGEFQRINLEHKDDESHATQLLQLLPTAFLLTPAGEQDGCTRFAFRPNPAFRPSTYEERVVSAMGGTVSLKEPMDRLCQMEATILQPVEFGFGLLGTVQAGGHFSLTRVPVAPQIWKSNRISVHIAGRVLMLKTLTREQDTVRTDIHLVPQHLSLAQAAQLTLP